MSSDQATSAADGVRVLVGSDMFGYTLYCGGGRIYVYREALPALVEQLAHFLVSQSFDLVEISRIADILATDGPCRSRTSGD